MGPAWRLPGGSLFHSRQGRWEIPLRDRRPSRDEHAPQIRVNNRIRAPEVRVINPDGQMLGVYPLHQALAVARELDLDLVEVNPKSSPPVCRIMDFGKFKYEKKKQEALARKRRTEIEVKEVKMRPKTDDHDYRFKLNHIQRFLRDGNKAKVTIRFRGRELAHPEVARKLLDRIIEETKDVAIVEQTYRLEGRAMHIVLAPRSGRGGVVPPHAAASTATSPVVPAQAQAGAAVARKPSEDEAEEGEDVDEEDDEGEEGDEDLAGDVGDADAGAEE